jgi:hypothetical protein
VKCTSVGRPVHAGGEGLIVSRLHSQFVNVVLLEGIGTPVSTARHYSFKRRSIGLLVDHTSFTLSRCDLV